MSHDHGPPPGEEPRWLDHPANVRKLTIGFFAVALLFLLADVVWFFVERHATFHYEDPINRTAVQETEHWPGFYTLYSVVEIVVLVALSVLFRKFVMRPEDYYSRDYQDPENEFTKGADDAKGVNHG